jgi:DNA primase
MKSRLVDLEAATAAVRPFLGRYLQEHGHDTTKNFRCINPKHEDENFSMTIAQVSDVAYCFGCKTAADIFSAAGLIEGKPTRGPAFVEENVLYLAKKYGVSIDMADLTAEEVYEYRTYQAYKKAAALVADSGFGDYTQATKEIEFRGWDISKLQEWGVGTVNFQDFREQLKQSGFEPGFLDSIDLSRSNLFNEDNLIFTVYDEYGRPVGFSARNLKYNKDDKTSSKYNNTRVTGLACNIFRKGERLYGFEFAKDIGRELYIFEGQADVITARHNGYMNCCCVLGSSFTDHHINLLKKHGVFKLIFVFDADEGGKEAIQKILDEKLASHKDFVVKLIHLPDGMDPDQLFREKGPDEFVRMKRWDAFEWRLNKFDENTESEEIARLMIPIILTERNHLRHEKLAKILARRTGFDLTTIMSEIKRQRSEKESDMAQRKLAIIENALWRAKQNPDDASIVLTEARANIEDVQRRFGDDSMGNGTMRDFVLSQKDSDEKKSSEFAGFFMRPDGIGSIAARLDDDWKKDIWMCVGGTPQTGKTSFVTQMGLEIVEDPRNNAMMIYHTIDDAKRFILFKMVCVMANNLSLTLGHVSNPNYWKSQGATEQLNFREEGYRKLLKLIQENKVIMKDSSDSPSLAFSENILRYYREMYPDRNILLIIDNFHKLPDYAEKHGQERVKSISNHVKQMATGHHASIISTIEYKKIYDDSMPSNSDIADSRAIEYDSSAVLHMHNDMHMKGANRHQALYVHEWEGQLLPRVRVDFGKNKISGFEGTEILDFFPKNALMKAVDIETARKEFIARKELLRNSPDGMIMP